MSDIVLSVENLWKQYRLGVVGASSLREDVSRWLAKLRGKEDPTLKVGETNDRENLKGQYVWALQDINFEVKRGEVLGIIGKNGAGKSTLLKILSKVTTPTKGRIRTKGRIASLLEVGTGFHPELTGRENIFLNGAILGMTKNDIRKKFDEIVEFSGVGKYIDTPVKRYSSGMYVRLAFAVAAHLEPEILIVDEVLAVGDAEFQKKCLGKMKDVSSEGRTVLFVSHNMVSVNTLCTQGMYLKNGKIEIIGATKSVVSKYLSVENTNVTKKQWKDEYVGDDEARLLEARLIDANGQTLEVVEISQKIGIEYEYQVLKGSKEKIPNIHVYNDKGECVFVSGAKAHSSLSCAGLYKTIAWIPPNLLNDGTYVIGIALSTMIPLKVHFFVQKAIIFDVIENTNERVNDYNQSIPGVVRPILEWETSLVQSV
jgi:lipopolysaccharide transport system ATP-binding protein